MTAAACNLQRISRMLRNGLYFSSSVNTSTLTMGTLLRQMRGKPLFKKMKTFN